MSADRIPPEVIYMITAVCDAQTKARCSRVCTLWNAHVNWNLEESMQCFQYASEKDNVFLLNKLLRNKRFDFIGMGGIDFAMRCAAKYGSGAVMELLIKEYGVDPSFGGNRYLKIASKHGRIDIVNQLLLDLRVQSAGGFQSAYGLSAEEGHMEVARRLLDEDFDPSIYNNEFMRDACRSGHLILVDKLLEDPRVDPSARNNHALHLACENGHLNVVDRLLRDPRVDPGADDSICMYIAAKFGSIGVVERLLQDPRVDPGADDKRAIKVAAICGRIAVVERLLREEKLATDRKHEKFRALTN